MIRRNTCKVCRHPQAREIDAALRAGEPRRAVMRRFGLPEWSTQWHWRYHVVVAATDPEREAAAFTRDLERLCRETERELREAERRGRLRRYRRAWMRLKAFLTFRALVLGVVMREPQRADLPTGRARGGRLMRGKRLEPVVSGAPSTPADPLLEFRRQRREQYRRLGLSDF